MNTEPLTLISAEELVNLSGPTQDELASLLRSAATQVERGFLDSAAWRVADAAVLLKQRIEAEGWQAVQGIHSKTGRGGLL